MRKLLVVAMAVASVAAAPIRPAVDQLPAGAIARLGHARMVGRYGYVAVAPDGRSAFSGKWFDLTTGKEMKAPVYVPEGGTVNRFFSDGSYLVGTGSDYQLFRPQTNVPLVRFPFNRGYDLFDAAGKFCLQHDRGEDGDESEVALIDLSLGLRNGRRILAKTKDEPYGGGLSSDGKHAGWLESGRGKEDEGLRCIGFYDVAKANLKRIELPRRANVGALAISPDGKSLALNDGKHIDLIDTATGKVVRTVDNANSETRDALMFSPDSKEVAVRLGRGSLLVPRDPKQPARRFPFCVARFLPDSRRAVTHGAEVGMYGQGFVLALHDLKTGKQLDPHSRYPAFHGVRMIGGHTAASWNASGLLVTWDVRTGKATSEVTLVTKAGHPCFTAWRFSPDGRHVAAWGDGVCVLAETATGRILKEVTDSRAFFHPSRAEAAMYVPERNASRGIDLKTGKWTSDWPAGIEGEVQLSGDARTALILAITRDTILVRESASGRNRWSSQKDDSRIHLLTLTNQGRTVFAVRERDLATYDVVTGRMTATVPLHQPRPRSAGESCAVSANSRWVAVLDDTDSLKTSPILSLLDLASDTPSLPVYRGELPVPNPYVSSLAFDRTGARLVTAHLDGTCHVWDVKKLSKPPIVKRAEDWDLLGRADPAEALPAITAFVKEPARAVASFSAKLVPVVEVAPAKVTAWVKDLDSDEFDRRTAAERELVAAHDQAEAALRQAIDRPLSLEQHRRVERLLKRIDPATDADLLRQMRAVEILERLGTKEAIGLLEQLAGGATAARLTREAKESLTRLKARDE